MVFGAVAGDGRVMPPHFVPAGLRIGTNEYLTILEEFLILWMEQHYSLDQVVLVQDSALAHTAHTGARSPKAEDTEVRGEREMAPSLARP